MIILSCNYLIYMQISGIISLVARPVGL